MTANLIDIFRIKVVIGFGSSFTGTKRGLNPRKDIDLIIVSDFFNTMSLEKRKKIIQWHLGKRTDPIILTTDEYNRLLKRKSSIVNVALKEGLVLFDSKR
jgi:hypothetical protein